MPPRKKSPKTKASKDRCIGSTIPDGMDAVLLVAPRGCLKELNGRTRLVVANLVARETILPYLSLVSQPTEFAEDDLGPAYRYGTEDRQFENALIDFTTKLVSLISGRQGEDSKDLARSLRPVAAKLSEWPAMVGKANLDPAILKEVGLGSAIGKCSLTRKADSPITKEADRILADFVQLFDQLSECRQENFSRLFGYIAEEPEPLSSKTWVFWKPVISDVIDERFGPPTIRDAVRAKRAAYENQRGEELKKKGDWINWPRKLSPEQRVEMARQKLLRRSDTSLQHGPITEPEKNEEKKWSFSSLSPELREHVRSRNLFLKGEEALFGKFKREMLKILEQRFGRLSVGT